MDHFAVCCPRNSRVNEVIEESEYFLGSITDCGDIDAWYTKLPICGKTLKFKIDTGADISVISEATYNMLPIRPGLQKFGGNLKTPGGEIGLHWEI